MATWPRLSSQDQGKHKRGLYMPLAFRLEFPWDHPGFRQEPVP